MPLTEFLQEAGYTVFRLEPGYGDVRVFLAGLVQSALSVVGVIFFIMILYGGYLWLAAAGNDEQVSRGKKMVRDAIVGFVITLCALIITRFIVGFIEGSTSGGAGMITE